MNMVDIRKMAKSFGIKHTKMNKVDLIRSIQHEEGNPGCYQTNASVTCSQERCCWRDSRVLEIASKPDDWVLDSFGGSGTTGAVAHKMGRRWIMVELGEHCHTHIIPRMKKVVAGTDQGGISEAVGWKGGGGFKYYRLAESLLVRDKELSTKDHPVYVINPRYDETLLIRGICKIAGFKYRNDGRLHGISSENRFLHRHNPACDSDVSGFTGRRHRKEPVPCDLLHPAGG